MRRNSLLVLSLSSCLIPAAIIGCGGGGGGSSSPRPTSTSVPIDQTPTPGPTTLPNGCTTESFTPNYTPSLGGFQRWAGFPLRVYLEPTDARTRALTLRGFDQWVTATGNRVRYEVVTDSSTANITVGFGIFEGGDQLGETVTYYFPSDNRIQRAEIEFLYYAFDSRADAEDINQSVAAHEFGHALGIGGHSPSRIDLMFPSISSGPKPVTTSDLNTLRTIYCDTFPTRSSASIQRNEPLVKSVIQ